MPVDTKEFRRSSAFSRWLRRRLERAILPRCDPNLQGAYQAQFNDSSRNVEIAAEGLLRLLRHHPGKSFHVLRGVANWRSSYYGVQREMAQAPRYLVYTQHDARIPFRPEEDILYAYMIAQISYVADQLSSMLSAKGMRHVAESFIALNDLGIEAFRRHPTLTPRYLEHDRLTLKVVQVVDDPINCCPSLHIAYSIFLDNLADFLIRPFRGKRDVFDSIRLSTIGMFNSVLYTKQHSIVDIAFGILCAKLVFEQRFDQPFNDFTGVFPDLRDEHPIPYERIEATYREVLLLHDQAGSLPDALGVYLTHHGFPLVDPGGEATLGHFDTERREIIDRSELR